MKTHTRFKSLDIFRYISIKYRLLVLLCITVPAMLLIFMMLVKSRARFDQMKVGKQIIQDIKMDTLTLKNHEKDFLAYKQLKFQKQFNEVYQSVLVNLNRLEQYQIESQADTQHMKQLEKIYQSYHDKFNQIVAIQEEIGQGISKGLHFELIKSVNRVEHMLEINEEWNLYAKLLILRKNEKDFMFYQDKKYLFAFREGLAEIETYFQDENDIPRGVKLMFKRQMKIYESRFNAYIAKINERGINNEEGLLKEMKGLFEETTLLLDQNASEIDELVVQRIDAQKFKVLTIFCSTIMVLIIVTFLIGRGIAVDVDKFKNDVQSILVKNDFTKRVEVQTKGEIKVISDAFNGLLNFLQSAIKNINTNSHALSTASDQLRSTTREIEKTTDEINSQVERSSIAMTETHGNIVNQVMTSESVNQKITDIQKKAKNAEQNAQSGRTFVTNATKSIRKIEESSTQMGGVIDVIKTITTRINLLSLNASIEAAKAGEMGRGFSVVANEVRTLADRSNKATHDIEALIVQSTENVAKGSRVVQQTARAFEEIIDNVIDVSSGIEDISDSMKSHDSTTKEISEAIQQVTESAESNSMAMQELFNSVQYINQTAGSFNNMANTLREEISMFQS